MPYNSPECLQVVTQIKFIFAYLCQTRSEALTIFMYYWMNSSNNLCSKLDSRQYSCSVIQIFILYCGPPTGKSKIWYEPRPATEVIQVDLNYGNTASPCGEPGKQVITCTKGNAQVWVTTHGDNAATWLAGAVAAATQSLAIKLYTYMHLERAGESLPYLNGPVCWSCMALT